MARPRLPDAVKAAKGTLRADRKTDEMEVTPGVASFNETNILSEKLAYEKLAEMFELTGIVGREDSLALRQLANALYRWTYAKAIVDEFGPYESVTNTQKQLVSKESAASRDLKEWDRKVSEHLGRFGATPSSRAAVAKLQSDTDASTKILELFSDKFNSSAGQDDLFSTPAPMKVVANG